MADVEVAIGVLLAATSMPQGSAPLALVDVEVDLVIKLRGARFRWAATATLSSSEAELAL